MPCTWPSAWRYSPAAPAEERGQAHATFQTFQHDSSTGESRVLPATRPITARASSTVSSTVLVAWGQNARAALVVSSHRRAPDDTCRSPCPCRSLADVHEQKVPFVPLLMEHDWRPSGAPTSRAYFPRLRTVFCLFCFCFCSWHEKAELPTPRHPLACKGRDLVPRGCEISYRAQ